MSTLQTFDALRDRVSAGDRLSDTEVTALALTPDILPIGMLADAARQQLSGSRVTYLRVASYPCDHDIADVVPLAAREVRIVGAPASLEAALTAVERTQVVAEDRVVSGFSWSDVVRLAASDGMAVAQLLAALRSAGLDALLEVPLDAVGEPDPVVEGLAGAGFRQVRLTVHGAPAARRTALMLRAASLQARYGCIQSLSPLPTALQPFRPTTGYDDVRSVAVARLAAPNIPMIQVDWMRYGPKLAQVALTFGADDLDGASSATDQPDGPRRAPIEELRRNIVAAGLTPAERDGRFNVIA